MSSLLVISECRRMRALLRLAEAQQEACLRNDPRQAAVRIESLRPVRDTDDDIAWLVNEGLVEYETILTEVQGKRPPQHDNTSNALTGITAVVITDAGLARVAVCVPQIAHIVEPVPHWDAASGVWTLDGELVKHFGENATAQRRILQACQDAEWAHETINNPWCAMSATQRSRYLRVAIARLNKGQNSGRTIHFTSIDDGRKFREHRRNRRQRQALSLLPC